MELKEMTQDVEVIQTLPDQPNMELGMDAQTLKAKFDEAPKVIKEYLNGQVVPAFWALQGQQGQDAQAAQTARQQLEQKLTEQIRAVDESLADLSETVRNSFADTNGAVEALEEDLADHADRLDADLDELTQTVTDIGQAAEAGAIVCTASGSAIRVEDSADRPLKSLVLYGKTEQGVYKLVSPCDDGTARIYVRGENLEDIDTIELDVPAGLCGVPVSSGGNYTDASGQDWICDETDLVRGVYVQRLQKKVFTGDEALEWDPDVSGRIIWNDAQEYVPGWMYILCSHVGGNVIKNCRVNDAGQIYFDCVSSGTTLGGFKSWLKSQAEAGMPLMTVGLLAEPVENEIDMARIDTRKPHTTLISEGGAFMKMEYVADTKTYIDNKPKIMDDGAVGPQDTANLAGVIVCEASGTEISVADAADRPLRGLRVFGRTEQHAYVGKNLVDVDAMVNDNMVNNGDGSYTMTRTGTTSADRFSAWFNVSLPAGSYVISASLVDTNAVDTGYLYLYVKYADATTGNYRLLQAGFSQQKLTFDKDVAALRLYIYSTEEVGTYCTFRDLQLEAGDERTECEPYVGGDTAPSPAYPQKLENVGDSGSIGLTFTDGGSASQALTIATPNGLPGIPVSSGGNYTDENGQAWICDEVDFEPCVYIQRICTINAREKNWSMSGQRVGRMILSVNKEFVKGSRIYCSHYKWVAMNSLIETNNIYVNSDSQIYINTEFATLEEWREYITNNDVMIAYAMAKPVETPLPEEELAAYRALHTNKPNTVVLNDAGAGMTVSYVADTKTYIDNKFNELAAAIVSGV